MPRDLFVHDTEEFQRLALLPEDNARMIRRVCPQDEILIYVDGHCQHQNFRKDLRAGCAVITRPESLSSHIDDDRKLSFHIETNGPTNESHPPMLIRTNLRAAIAALDHCDWVEEGWSCITVASNSTTLVNGITRSIVH
jgi:ribonuclease HI